MDKRKVLLVASVVVLSILLPLTVYALPRQQGENVLQNGGFEGAYSAWSGIPQLQMPVGWTPWWADNSAGDPDWANHRPEWKPAEGIYYPTRVHSGERAIQWFKSYATFWAGAYQQVNVPENAQLRFSAYGFGWSCDDWDLCSDASSHNPANMRMRIGIDPTGGTNPWSPSIVWSPTASPVWAWEYFQVEAAAQGGTVTVFLYSNPDWPRQNQDSYFDDASLVVIGDAPPPTSEPGTPAPNPQQPAPAPIVVETATPQPDGSIIHTVQAGDTPWSVAARYGITYDELVALNDLGAFIQPGQQLIVRLASEGAPAEPAPVEEPETGGEAASEEPAEEVVVPPAQEEETPDEAAEPVAEVAAAPEGMSNGTICVSAFQDSNVNGLRDAGEELLSGVLIKVANEQQDMGSYTTDGASEPYCFQGLPAGSYRIMQQAAGNWVATTLSAWGVSLQPGSVETLEFGNRAGQAEDMVAPAGDADTESNSAKDEGQGLQSSLFTGLGVFGLLLIMGAGVFILLSRRSSV